MANLKSNSRATIFDNGDFSLHASIVPVSSPKNGHALTITSQRKESRNPTEEQVRFFTCLDNDGLQSLLTLIQSHLLASDSIKKHQVK